MPIRFDMEDNALFVRPSDLAIREFMDIWEADTSNDKQEAQDHLKFIYHYCDTRSEFFDSEDVEKLANCKANAYGAPDYKHSKKWAKLVEKAMARYEQLNEKAPLRAVATLDKKIDQIRTIIDATLPIIEDRKVYDKEGNLREEIKSNVKTIIDTSISLDKMAETREKMYERAMTGGNKTKNRAGAETSLLEAGKLGIQPVKMS
jgi:hypothetical protein